VSRHLAIVGPTATGKSALALAVARACGDAEIVSLDSMQVYRGMDIGTAKPTAAERAEVRHHLVDVGDPAADWSVARTQCLARRAIGEIEARGRRALLVGGTGLYVQAVIDGLTIPGRDADVRARYWRETDTDTGRRKAYARLQRLDPVAAARIEPTNRRRVVRALEVIEVTGRPFSSFGPGVGSFPEPDLDARQIGLWMPRQALGARIARRFAGMRDAGFVDEVAELAARPGGLSRTAEQAIGYAELLAYVRGVQPSLQAAFEHAVRRTRTFARRQRVWFRRDPRIQWIATPENSVELAPAILATWSRPVPAGAR
jgi:tRNA dimethylallyltransferase